MSMKKEKADKLFWLGSGMAAGIATLSVALGSVPKGRITDDTALYQNLSEIRVAKERDLSFDSDINRLRQLEARYHENLPALNERVRAPMQRISQTQYRYSGGKKRKTVRN